ncbi:urease accessory protein UreF [Micromonospora parathelypteridis]|uniref:Urease accessory protein UreF n=1 Tax=Micromonospora parathelypteridis TaxID=1839617 RepID=A0A840VTZ2_9ACTN|nr:urease accessory UreF family protein [Micromonospora parathelypteridis]MBB5475709.1 urease accessory protein [Micromonospora parathelypteridis]GGO26922.1 urease accessory protein UreF [Micromonospora parathelypteridis]
MATPSLLLLLADGRFPAGAHAHSGGLEAAVAAGRVTDLVSLEAFLAGRLATAGLVGAAFAAAAHRATVPGVGDAAEPARSAARSNVLARLDAELDARTAAPALRTVSRRQGRALLRAGRAIWPDAPFGDLPATACGAHQPLVLGLLGSAAGLSRLETATVAAYGTLTGAASAGVRLLGLDPYRVQALLVGLADACDGTAADAAQAADDPPERLPAAAAPLTDIHAEVHATWEVRLFAS